jgi:hypothetical protein
MYLSDNKIECILKFYISLSLFAVLLCVIGNSSFGSTLLDTSKHKKVKYCRGSDNARLEANKNQFHSLTRLGGSEVYEIMSDKTLIQDKMPVQIGVNILNRAKAHMLSFVYDFLKVYMIPGSYQMVLTDTDSIYLSLAHDHLDKCIIPEKMDKYMNPLTDNCSNADYAPNGDNIWFCRRCCDECQKIDKKIPGLFKYECRGSNIVALCSKSYSVQAYEINGADGRYLLDDQNRTIPKSKTSHKGVTRAGMSGLCEQEQVTMAQAYANVLYNGANYRAHNLGFRSIKNQTYTYDQQKKALNFLYVKRQVQPDGIHTRTLDLILKPSETTGR